MQVHKQILMTKKTWKIIDLLKETQGFFERKGIASPRLDAELLLAHCLNKKRVQLYIDFERPINHDELDRFREFVRRRAKREPVAYIVGYKEFWSLPVKVTPAVLIPRPETEILIETATRIIKNGKHTEERARVLELGTGSGALAIAFAKEVATCEMFSVDISRDALSIAEENLIAHGLKNSISLICGDGFQPFAPREHFDLIVSNPPYIRSCDIEELAPEIKYHEPRTALDGGKDGLDFYRRLIPQMTAFMKKGGWAVLELGAGQAAAVSELFTATGSFVHSTTVPDYSRRERVIVARKG